MKHLFKSLAVLSFVFTVFACQDDSNGIFEATTNKHDNARTTADFYASGTMTVPAGTYNTIHVAANSNITLANGVKFDQFYYGGTNPNIRIKTATGSIVTHYQDTWIPTGVTFIISLNSTLYSKADFLVGATTVDNLGNHVIDQSLILDQNATYNESLFSSFTAWRVWIRQPGAKIDFGTGNQFVMPNMTMTILDINPQFSSPNAIFYGKGKITTQSGTVRYVPLTGSSTIKVCTSTPLVFSNGGSFGIGYYGC